jgi:hypothetical protein
MPKIGPNKVSIDPKAYAARVTSAKKRVAQMDPAIKAKIKDMYPKVTREDAVKQALDTKKAATFRAAAGMKKSNLTDKMPAMSGPMRRKTIETLKQDAKNVQPKGPAKPNTMKKAPATGMKTTTKPPVKKKVVQMPSKISPSKMTPAQKAKYLQNPERYDK